MTIFRSLLAIVVGALLGSAVNMGLILLGPSIIPPPAGVDVSNAQSIGESIHLFEPKHFVMPFLAHALGTLVGAFCAYLIAAVRKPLHGWIIGLLFFCGGIAASTMIPAPVWFIAVDLVLAYLPMAWLGNRLAARAAG